MKFALPGYLIFALLLPLAAAAAELELQTPLAARVSDALTRQDREAAVEILEHEHLLLNEEMNLLYLAGRRNEAADIAFLLMERSPQDEGLYEQSAPMLLLNGRSGGVSSTLYALDSYSVVNTRAETGGHRFGGLNFDLGVYQESRTNVDAALLNDAPAESGGDITVRQRGDSYVNSFMLQFSRSLNTQTALSLKHQHQIGARFNLDTMLAYNEQATVNALMRIVGRSNQLGLEGSYKLDAANQWMFAVSRQQYHSIDDESLGSGNQFSTTLGHAFSESHPALRARITASWYQFSVSDNTLDGAAAGLIPAGNSSTPAYFMPQDVSELAAYASLGEAAGSNLPAHDLEYFAELGVFYNPFSGSGWRASTGLGGRVLGADSLRMYMRYDQSPNGQGYSSMEAGIAYLLHY